MTSDIFTADSSVRVFTGLTQDVFAGDSAALRAFEAAFAEGQYKPEAFDNHVNFFAGRRVASIVLEVPNELIGVGRIHAWATVSLHGHAPERQVARWGLPLITHLFVRDDELRESYNRTTPSADNAPILNRIGEVIRETTFLAGTAADPQAYAQRVLDRFGALTLPYELGTPASFDYVGFNGRALHDDVMDVMLSLMTNSPLGDGANPDPDRIAAEFPYLTSVPD